MKKKIWKQKKSERQGFVWLALNVAHSSIRYLKHSLLYNNYFECKTCGVMIFFSVRMDQRPVCVSDLPSKMHLLLYLQNTFIINVVWWSVMDRSRNTVPRTLHRHYISKQRAVLFLILFFSSSLLLFPRSYSLAGLRLVSHYTELSSSW